MCAGAPDPRPLSDSVRAVACARSMLSIVERYKTPTSRRPIKMRIGCHTGVVLGCVMGRSVVRAGSARRTSNSAAHTRSHTYTHQRAHYILNTRACRARVRHSRFLAPQPRYQLFGRDMDVVQV